MKLYKSIYKSRLVTQANKFISSPHFMKREIVDRGVEYCRLLLGYFYVITSDLEGREDETNCRKVAYTEGAHNKEICRTFLCIDVK